MSSGRKEGAGKSSADESDHIRDSSRAHTASQQDENVASRGVETGEVTDTKRTIHSRAESHALDPDVEEDALMSSEADERSCLQPNNPTEYLPPKYDTSDHVSGLQESVSTTDSFCYVRSAGAGRSTAGEKVTLMSSRHTTGATAGNWNNTVVLPVDEQRTNQSTSLQAAGSPQAAMSGGGHSAVAGLIRENAMLRETNKKQAEKIHQLTTEMARIRDVPRLSSDLQRRASSDDSNIVHLLNEQIAVYKEDFDNERRDKERALSEKDSLMKQTTTLLNDLKALQERNSQLEAALRVARQNMSSDDAERRRSASRWTD